VAAALGALLTPVIVFIDPGLAKNKDWASVFSQTTEPVSAQDVAQLKPESRQSK